jgi:WD40 repeat protein
MTTDFGGNSYLWQTDNDYEPITIPEEFSEKTAKTISDGVVYFDGKGTAAWDLTNDQIQSNIKVRGEIVDTDKEGNVLALSHNEFMFYNDDSLQFRGKHPDWPIYVESIDTLFHAPASLYLTTGILSESSIFTASTDRSIRSWNKEDGTLIDDLLGHRATVSAMDLSKSETQLVSVDLKGGLKFWDLK